MSFFTVDHLRDKTVIIADDDAGSRSLLRGALRTIGMHVLEEARDGAIALKAVERLRPNVLCLEIELSQVSGLDVLAKIRETNKSMIVIFISAAASADNVKRALSGGADGFVGKPFNTGKIKDAIERAVLRREPKS